MEGTNAEAKTPLHRAIATKDIRKCLELVSQGADVDSVDRCGVSALEEASLRGFQDIFDALQPFSKRLTPRQWDTSEVTCPICFAVFVKPVTIVCGHTFCRSCLQLSRRPHNRCCLCRKPVQFENGMDSKAMGCDQLILCRISTQHRSGAADPKELS
jgi:hypothetical protein